MNTTINTKVASESETNFSVSESCVVNTEKDSPFYGRVSVKSYDGIGNNIIVREGKIVPIKGGLTFIHQGDVVVSVAIQSNRDNSWSLCELELWEYQGLDYKTNQPRMSLVKAFRDGLDEVRLLPKGEARSLLMDAYGEASRRRQDAFRRAKERQAALYAPKKNGTFLGQLLAKAGTSLPAPKEEPVKK